MSTANTIYDVYLSAVDRDAAVARVVRRALEGAGLTVYSSSSVGVGADWGDNFREALVESQAFVAILTPASVKSNWVTLEYGGALAWGKPIYLIRDNLDPDEVPSFLRSYRTVPIAHLSEVVGEISRGVMPFSEHERELLAGIYPRFRTSTEQLASKPATLDSLTQEFKAVSGTTRSPERVLQELVRLRKQGKLPKFRRRQPGPGRRA